MRNQIGIGIVGASGAFGQFIGEAIEEMGGAHITAVAGFHPERTELARQHLHAEVAYTDYAAFIADPAVDLVIISTPPGLHAAMGIAAARAGKAIFVEKPIATTVQDAKDLVHAVREAGVASTVDFVMRYNSIFDTLRSWIDTGLLGELQYVDFRNNAADEFLPPDHWFWDREQSGGILVEHGVHFFDIYGSLIGSPPVAVHGILTKRPGTDQEDKVMASILYENRKIGNFYHSFDKPSRVERTSAVLGFDRGYATVDGWIATSMSIDVAVSTHELDVLRATPYMHIESVEDYAGNAQFTRGNGHDYIVNAQVRGVLELPRSKQDVYRTSVADALADIVASMADSTHKQRVRLEDGARAVALACAAGDAGEAARLTKTWNELAAI